MLKIISVHLFLRIGFIVFCIFSHPYFGLCQQRNPSHPKAAKIYKEAIGYLNLNQYPAAIQSLQKVLAYDASFAVGHQQLADIYLRLKDFENAAEHYKQVISLAPTLTPSTWFGLGESLLYTGAYREAKSAFTEYLSRTTPTSTNKELAEKYLIDCDFSIKALSLQKQDSLVITNIGEGINSKDDEYFPMLTADKSTIIFTRQAKGDLEYLYASQHLVDFWETATPIPGQVNTTEYSEGAHCVSPDGKYLFFTGCNRPEGKGSCDIYVSHWDGQQWSTPFNLGAPINSGGWEAQPAISPDGSTLYFVSNRKGGYGGNDIWYSTVSKDGSWSAPKNMGPLVNTTYDEGTPFIHADGETLYFASNGWPGFGDKDIFISKMDSTGKRHEPANLGYPINDFHEQRAFTVSLDGTRAYFAANRSDSYGGLDIYTCPLSVNKRPKPVGFVKGKIVDARNDKPMSATVRLVKLGSQQEIFHIEADYTDGGFLVPLPLGNDYALQVSRPSYLFYTYHFGLSKGLEDGHVYTLNIPLSPISIGSAATLNNIFFPVNGFELLPESQADLVALKSFMENNPKVKIEIAGHTDNSGNEQDNQLLSEKRALSVYCFLLENGIAGQRLTYKGYGQSKPIADNSTNDGKQKNRRTDFKIIAVN